MRAKIAACISGGVDSAVAAYLLKKEGRDVVGVFMRNWDADEEAEGVCSKTTDVQDARIVAKRLSIPLIEMDFVKEYWNDVFLRLIEGHSKGITPNPDILCNKLVKFGHLQRKLSDNIGITKIATGHYARIAPDGKGVKLMRAKDSIKDQTFFLGGVLEASLKNVEFPLGDWLKPDVKRLAAELGLERLASKSESMGMCFIGKRSFRNFLTQYVEMTEGEVVDVDSGQVLGTYSGGFEFSTVGQRYCGLPGNFKDPLYVVSRNFKDRQIFVCFGSNNPALFSDSFDICGPHWIQKVSSWKSAFENGERLSISCCIQRNHRPMKCTIHKSSTDAATIVLKRPYRAICPGQFCVFYKDEECLGGGDIIAPGPSLSVDNYHGFSRESLPEKDRVRN